jgi:DNA-binding NarL/FixJ family response regulator
LLKVFIVEDSDDIADALTELLAIPGRSEIVGRASSEEGAIEWSFQNEAGFDVAVVDLILQGGSGFAVLTHLTKYQPGKVVVLSEFVTPAITQRCTAFGAVAAFPKSKMLECIAYVTALAGPPPT